MGHEGAPAELLLVDESASLHTMIPEVRDGPRDECGVYGIISFDGLAVGEKVYQGAYRLKHRGSSATGIGYFDPAEQGMVIKKGFGPPDMAVPFMSPDLGVTPVDAVRSHLALAHNRYSTDPSDALDAAQPLRGRKTGITVITNGHIDSLTEPAVRFGADISKAPSDSGGLVEILDHHLSQSGNIRTSLKEILPHVKGAYSLIIAYQGKLYGARDPQGVHPLSFGIFPNKSGAVIASEAIAYHDLELEESRDVRPGEIVVVTANGVESLEFAPPQLAHCLYEPISNLHPPQTDK